MEKADQTLRIWQIIRIEQNKNGSSGSSVDQADLVFQNICLNSESG